MEFTDEDLEHRKQALPELPKDMQKRFEESFNIPSETALFIIESKELASYFEAAVKLGATQNIDGKTIANAIKNKKVNWETLTPSQMVTTLAAGKTETLSDESSLFPLIEKVITDNPKVVEEYRSGKVQVLGFLVGQVMRSSQGKADAPTVNRLLAEKLNK